MAEFPECDGNEPSNPLDPAAELRDSSSASTLDATVHPQANQIAEDSAVTRAEKHERHRLPNDINDSPSKRRKLDVDAQDEFLNPTKSERQKGVVPIKAESVPS